MDVLYEESAVNASLSRGKKAYNVLNVLSKIFGVISLIALLFFLYFLFAVIAGKPTNASPSDEYAALLQTYETVKAGAFVFGSFLVLFGGVWLWCVFFKRRVNVSYDYTFVSGEIRIAKVFNVNRRKFLFRISSEDILQLGDVESDSYDRLKADPMTKEVVCTSNETPATGKFFLYIHALDGTAMRKLYILECREEMLVNILRFVKRGTLAPDYVAQDKKK